MLIGLTGILQTARDITPFLKINWVEGLLKDYIGIMNRRKYLQELAGTTY